MPREAARPLVFGLALLALAAMAIACRPGWQAPAAGARPARPARDELEATVARVIDGDTVVLSDGTRVRLLGIDSPESGDPGFDEARAAQRRLVEGRVVSVRRPGPDRADRYGRALGVLRVAPPGGGAPVCVNTRLVRLGLALVYQPSPEAVPAPLLEDLLEAQREALAARRGIWKSLSRVAHRHRLVATRLRVHRSGCRHLRGVHGTTVRSLIEELARGKSPCRTCRPLQLP